MGSRDQSGQILMHHTLAFRLAVTMYRPKINVPAKGSVGGDSGERGYCLQMANRGASGGLLIKGGTVVDGTGGAARRADVRVAGAHIVEIGADIERDGEDVIDAGGAFVCPGWI